METCDDKTHFNINGKKMILLGDVINKTWIQMPPELARVPDEKCNIKETIEILCLCEYHLTTLYILDANYWTFNCPSQGWCWIKKMNIDKVKKLKRI